MDAFRAAFSVGLLPPSRRPHSRRDKSHEYGARHWVSCGAVEAVCESI